MAIVEKFQIGSLTKRNAGAFVGIALLYCSLFAVPFIFLLFVQVNGQLDERGLSEWAFSPGLDLSPAAYRITVRLSIFSSVMAFGALGAAISVISRTHSTAPTSEGVSVIELLSIQTIGAVFAFILSLMFMGNMIAGSLFPTWDPFFRIIYSPAAFAKLLVWSFLAGFSERLVPEVLVNLSRHAKREPDSPVGSLVAEPSAGKKASDIAKSDEG